jgi:hypothetical protein
MPGGGEDTPAARKNDSWLVPLPIIECQNPGDGCAGGSAQKIVGVACLDIQFVSENRKGSTRSSCARATRASTTASARSASDRVATCRRSTRSTVLVD